MSHYAALPFTLRRGKDIIAGSEVTSTQERVHGLLHVDGENLRLQWRMTRTTERVGREIRTDTELGPVREIIVPLAALAAARVRWLWSWRPGYHLILTAADLRAFEEVAGEGGLRLTHPAELAVRIASAARGPAREFASEVQLAIADRTLRAAEDEQLAQDAGRSTIASAGMRASETARRSSG